MQRSIRAIQRSIGTVQRSIGATTSSPQAARQRRAAQRGGLRVPSLAGLRGVLVIGLVWLSASAAATFDAAPAARRTAQAAEGTADERTADERAVEPAPQRPNVVVFVADDVDWRDFGCYGNDAIRTPHIDRLAAAGLRCQTAMLTTPQCSPTRISVLSGQYAHTVRCEDLHTPLPPGVPFVTRDLAEAGYFCGHMRKTHYGPHGMEQFQWYSRNVAALPDFLAARGEQPFFLWVGFNDAHRPYAPGAVSPPHDPATVKVPPYLVDSPETRADLALYYDEISRMDGDIGTMIETLAEHDLLDNTLVVFFCDNGRPFPRDKGSVYDSGIGTALVFHWPAVIAPGTVYEGLVSVIDLAPTWLDAAGLKVPERMAGHSLLPMLRDPTLPGRQYAFSERNWHNCDEHMRSVRSPRYKLIRVAYTERMHGNPADLLASPSWQSLLAAREAGALTPAQQVHFRQPRPAVELYDLEADPYELENRADDPQLAAVRAELERALDDWQAETDDFEPRWRRRADDVDRLSGERHRRDVPPLEDDLPSAADGQ